LKEHSKIRVIFTEEYEHADPQAIVNIIFNLYTQYGRDNTFLFCDGSNRAMVNMLKIAFNESLNWERSTVTPESMKILPVNFATEYRSMLSHLAMIVSKSYLAVPASMDKLKDCTQIGL
jgi:hypothetical protein